MLVYITFGQVHTHSVSGKTFDKDTIAVIEADSIQSGHDTAMRVFDKKFHRALGDKPDMSYFPKGLVQL